ncbi:actin-histidine N-methyltransferase-like [Uranotaenia lowii]|uniref:actin-histidine N-methyltransferase-like n=1 Tax=Uranotaenia lowii TaxID=190385 RepID=UPI00247AA547|nr:actin-histidine N-methyltransferase-like [Uranotaenia lowii]
MTRQNLIPVDLSPAPAEAAASAGDQNGTNGKTEEDASKLPSGPSPVLIPLWDMANHVNGVITTGYNEPEARVESLTLKDYRKGEQIFIHYGQRTNADFLVHNGFVFPDNANSDITIQLSLSTNDELYEIRKALLEKLNLPSANGEFTVCRKPEPISRQLLGFARVFNMTKDQLAHWTALEKAELGKLLLPDESPFDQELREKVWKFLTIRLQLAIRMTGTTLEQDEALLAGQNQKGSQKLSHIRAMLVQYRVVEKKILHEVLDFCQEQLAAKDKKE